MTLLGDGTEKNKMHVESTVLQLDTGQRLTLIPWFQGDKAGKTTQVHTFHQVDLCQDAFDLVYDKAKSELRRQANMPEKAPAGRLLCGVKNTMNDRASVEKKRVNEIEAAIQILLGDPDFTLNRGECGHHQIGLFANAVQTVDHKLIVDRVGRDVDKRINEFKSDNAVDTAQRQLALLFGHHAGAYPLFGNGVIAFPTWFGKKFPGMKLHKMDRQVGNRHGILLKNAMVHYAMFDPYMEWCTYMKEDVKDENALHNRVLSKLATRELKASIRARGLYYAKIHHLLLTLIKSKERGATTKTMCEVMTKLKSFCLRMSTDASPLLDPAVKLFPDDPVHTEYDKWACSTNNAILISKLLAPDENTRELTLSCLQAYCASVVDQLQSNSSEYIEGGEIWTLYNTPEDEITDEQKLKRKHFEACPTTSDAMVRFMFFCTSLVPTRLCFF